MDVYTNFNPTYYLYIVYYENKIYDKNVLICLNINEGKYAIKMF